MKELAGIIFRRGRTTKINLYYFLSLNKGGSTRAEVQLKMGLPNNW